MISHSQARACGRIAFGVDRQLAVLGGVALAFPLSSLTPLERGVRYVSNLNMVLAATACSVSCGPDRAPAGSRAGFMRR